MTTTQAEPALQAKPNLLSRLFAFLWQRLSKAHLLSIFIALVLLIGSKCASLVVPWLLGRLVGSAAERIGDLLAVMGGLIAAYVMARFFQVLFAELKNTVFVHVVQNSIKNLASAVFVHLHNLPLEFHHSRQTGGLAVQIERGTKGIEFLISTITFNFLPTIIELLAVCVIFWGLYGLPYAAVTFFTVLVYAAFTVVVSNWRIKFRRRLNNANEVANTQAIDSLLNHETVKIFSAEKREAQRYVNALENYENAAIIAQRTLSLLNLGQALLITAGLAALLLIAARDTAAGTIDAGDLATLNAYLLQMFVPLGYLGSTYRVVSQSITDIEKTFGLLDVPSSTPDATGALPLEAGPGRIEYRSVGLSLGGRKVLDDVSFTVPAGKCYALVGETGSGKTTITRLLARFLDPDSGNVLIDGQDLRSVTQLSVRQALAFVPQDAVMFNDTLRLNLSFGKPDASEEEIRNAIDTAGLTDFIAKLPEEFETQVGERGIKLSGGERQRLAIARALLKQPRIFIMDEATSALDVPTEAKVKTAMAAAAKGHTTLIIAHRLATVTASDRILVISQGKITEQGTHEQLLEANGHYARAWKMQSQHQQIPNLDAAT